MKLRKNLDGYCLFIIDLMSILLKFKENVYTLGRSKIFFNNKCIKKVLLLLDLLFNMTYNEFTKTISLSLCFGKIVRFGGEQ